MEKLTTEGGEFENGEVLTFTQVWSGHRVKTRGTLRKRGDEWIIEYHDQGYKIEKLNNYNLENGHVKLQKIPVYVPPPPRVFTEEERLAIETQAATAMKQRKIEREPEIKKLAEEDRLAETVYDKIPCSSQRVNVSDSVLYNDKLATVTDVLYEITYEDGSKEVVKCDGSLINVSYAINLNKDNLNRKEEILRWYTKTSIAESFVILDDDKSLNGLPNHIKDNAIITSGTVGLTIEQAQSAIAILKKEKYAIA
jgi:hypothetical protein